MPALALLALLPGAGLFARMQAQTAGVQAQTKELHVAAAADLQPVLRVLAEIYEKTTGVRIVPSFGSSAALTQRLEKGDPQDVFLSADYVDPEQLVAAGRTVGGEPTPYARGVLVLWARKDSPAQPLTLESLSSPKVTRIAIANELRSPYGLAGTRALASLGLTGKVAGKLVVAENVAQTAQLAESGNAQAGLISLTLASTAHLREVGSFVRLPPSSYPQIQQCGVVLKASTNQAGARLFLNWLTSYEVQHNLTRFGLDPVQ